MVPAGQDEYRYQRQDHWSSRYISLDYLSTGTMKFKVELFSHHFNGITSAGLDRTSFAFCFFHSFLLPTPR